MQTATQTATQTAALPARPLLPGTIIQYSDIQATVLKDWGTGSLEVLFEGERCKWYWTLDGETCKVIAAPSSIQ